MTLALWHSQEHAGGPMSEEQYLLLTRTSSSARYEYVHGIAHMLAGGSVDHDRIARNVTRFIEDQLLSGPCTAFGSDVQVLLVTKANQRRHYVYPDATISCDVADRRRGNTLIRSPRIVVEVLSPGTEAMDRGDKMAACQACPTIQEVVLISQFARHVEIYRRPDQATSEQQAWSAIIVTPTDQVELQSIDVQLTMDEIYEGIDFDEPLSTD